MPSCYLACPAYAAADEAQAAAAVAGAGAFCAELAWTPVPSPCLGRPGGIGTWLPLDQRLADWGRACEHDVIWAVRGGHGALELALRLAVEPTPARPHGLIGYSDITALHLLWHRRAWSGAIYGPIAAQALGPRARDSLLRACRGHGQQWSGSALPEATRCLRPGRASGPAFAGCLRLLAASCGTPLQPRLQGHVLLIEDIDERPYAVDRDLQQLAGAGALDGILGLVGSGFPHQRPEGSAGPDHATILQAWAERLEVPAVIGLPFGHDPEPLSIVQGAAVELTVADADWQLRST